VDEATLVAVTSATPAGSRLLPASWVPPPFRHSLPVTLAFAATASRPTALLTGLVAVAGTPHGLIRPPRSEATRTWRRVGLDPHPLTATAALVWNGDLPGRCSRCCSRPRTASPRSSRQSAYWPQPLAARSASADAEPPRKGNP
jgi:hypothetical protein